MDGREHEEIWLTAIECSNRIGLSIRALRLYEQYGLISPRRTAKQWRLYGSKEIARLNEILALKALGLSLSNIARLLRGHPTDLHRTLALQRDALAEAQRRAQRGQHIIESLQSKIGSGGTASIDDLMKLAKETNLNDPLKDTVAWRRYGQMRPRTEVAIDVSLYDDCVGAYELEDGPYCLVSRRHGQLFYRIVGQSDIEIFPENDTQFFMKILPVQVTFVRDPDGIVRSLIHHQNGNEDKAVRVDFQRVKNAEEEAQRRISRKIPMPQSESILRRVISEHARGEPDFDGMSPPLAALAKEQIDFIQSELKKAGALRTLSFKGVSQGSLDIYDVHFEHADMEWGFALSPSGKISALYLRPTP